MDAGNPEHPELTKWRALLNSCEAPLRQRQRRPRVYVHRLPREWLEWELKLLCMDDNLLPEEVGTHHYLLSTIDKSWDCVSPDKADVAVFPFNLACLCSELFPESAMSSFLSQVRDFRERAEGLRMFFFCLFDFCIKPTTRTSPVEALIQSGRLDLDVSRFQWMEQRDKVFHFESTADLLDDGIALFPLVASPIVRPDEQPRPWLFSFVGKFSDPDWPEGFVRSFSRTGFWQTLAIDNAHDCFLGSATEAADVVDGNPFWSVPQKSVFTLCPRGIAVWSFRLIEAIRAGSIPVVLSDPWVPPFASQIPWSSFCIQVQESDLWRLGAILRRISPEEVGVRQSALRDAQHFFTARGLGQLLTEEMMRVVPLHR